MALCIGTQRIYFLKIVCVSSPQSSHQLQDDPDQSTSIEERTEPVDIGETPQSFDVCEIQTESVDEGDCTAEVPFVGPVQDVAVQTTLGDWPKVAYQDLRCQRTKKTKLDLVTEFVSQMAGRLTHHEQLKDSQFVRDMLRSAKWNKLFEEAFVDSPVSKADQFLVKLANEYKNCKDRATNASIREKGKSLESKVKIGNSKSSSNLTSDDSASRTAIAADMGRIQICGDERRRLLSIVAHDFSQSELCKMFGCSSKTVTAARVHATLFGRGGVAPGT